MDVWQTPRHANVQAVQQGGECWSGWGASRLERACAAGRRHDRAAGSGAHVLGAGIGRPLGSGPDDRRDLLDVPGQDSDSTRSDPRQFQPGLGLMAVGLGQQEHPARHEPRRPQFPGLGGGQRACCPCPAEGQRRCSVCFDSRGLGCPSHRSSKLCKGPGSNSSVIITFGPVTLTNADGSTSSFSARQVHGPLVG